jgi:hypothetical protein
MCGDDVRRRELALRAFATGAVPSFYKGQHPQELDDHPRLVRSAIFQRNSQNPVSTRQKPEKSARPGYMKMNETV